MEKAKEYNINIKKGALHFDTTSFRAEDGSALHSGIYNRELTSSLAAGAVLVALAMLVLHLGVEVKPIYYGLALVLFTALFILFRKYVFYEEYLELIVDKASDRVTVFIKSLPSRKESQPLSELCGLRKGLTVIAPENPDGISVVKNIAVQHGMVIPGFGESKEFHSVNLEFTDATTVMVFSSEQSSEADAVLDLLKNFIGDRFAKTQ